MRKIACIGSRDAPPEYLELMRKIGSYIVRSKCCVATGNAQGSDQAFALGGNQVDSQKVILYLPWSTYEKSAIEWGNRRVLDHPTGCRELAARHHPAWGNLTQGVRSLMTRNASIILDSKLVIAYLNHSKQGGGGTGHGWRIAKSLGIPRIDLSEISASDEGFLAVKKAVDKVLS